MHGLSLHLLNFSNPIPLYLYMTIKKIHGPKIEAENNNSMCAYAHRITMAEMRS